jgi:hypothetical protein
LAAAQDFAGSRSCAVCHSAIAKTQSATHHARALERSGDGGWAFGAGAQAITPVSQTGEDSYVEHGLSWYRKTGARALTPGHSTNQGIEYRTFAPDAAILRCFQCHSTGALELTASRAIDPAEPGVRCESCHGAGAIHAAKPGRGNIRNPAKLTAAGVNDLCGTCHRMPPAQGVETNFENPWNVRHQPVYFSQSACFLKSGGKLSCISCHSPHEDKAARANDKCGECHAAPRHTSPVADKPCVTCHMPAVNPSPLLRFTNHWIGVYRLSGPHANLLRPVQQRARR